MRHVQHPLAILALALCTFLALDNVVFRTDLYPWIQAPDSLSGQIYNLVYYEQHRPQSGKKEILVTGNSRMDWAFWPHDYNISRPASRFKFIRAMIAATYEKTWYFLLNVIDPRHDRYAAIVIPVASYRVDPWPDDDENDFINLQWLKQVLSLSSWIELVNTFSDENIRARAIRYTVLASDGFGDDIQNLVAHPFHRIERLKARRRPGASWEDDWSGNFGSMEDFHFDPASGHILAFPRYFNVFERKDAARQFQRPSFEDAARFTVRNAAYQARWLNRIIDLYRDSETRLIFVQTPRSPFPLPGRVPIDSAPDLRSLLHANRNVSFLDEDAFLDLEQPQYFHDGLHINSAGRQLFTRQFGDRITDLLEGR